MSEPTTGVPGPEDLICGDVASGPGTDSALRRFGLGVAVLLTVGVIGAGTWALGGGADPAMGDERDQEQRRESSAGTGASLQPPLAVAPPPDSDARRADRSDRSGRAERGKRADRDR